MPGKEPRIEQSAAALRKQDGGALFRLTGGGLLRRGYAGVINGLSFVVNGPVRTKGVCKCATYGKTPRRFESNATIIVPVDHSWGVLRPPLFEGDREENGMGKKRSHRKLWMTLTSIFAVF